ncbi:MAG: hypothetical protein HOV80_22010, partial [Polyangiaceae bacterium]|nr:hypothetical protein [Polyangiaceae bacterium]
MIRPKRDAVVIVLGLLLAACQEGSDLADAKRTPKPPPPETTALPEVSITVEIDGKPASPIDAARLAMVTPDFA